MQQVEITIYDFHFHVLKVKHKNMGGLVSKKNAKPNPYAGRSTGQEKQYSHRQQVHMDVNKAVMTPPTMEKQIEVKESPRLSSRYANVSDDELYDGIPRYQRSSSPKSRSLRVTKVSEVSYHLGRAGSIGLESTAKVLDKLGSSVNTLNLTGGFVSGATARNNKLSILAFEVANTIVKASNLMKSLSKRSMRQLKEVVFPAEGVQQIISKDMNELLSIVATDKREELKVFSGEVVRFGNLCKDPQWHNLNLFFEKHKRNRTPHNQVREVAESVMLQLMKSVQLTAELYQELHTLDRVEQDYQLKRLEELSFNTSQRGDRDNSLNILEAEVKSQRKLVKNLKKKSLWSRSMEEVMEKLVDIVLFLNQEIRNTFGSPVDGETTEKGSLSSQQKLGAAGLALHYANIILQIDAIVARSNSIPPNFRDTLYQSLPPNFKASLRSKILTFHVEKQLTVSEIKNEMEKTLHWLVPVATNTAKAHHGFGWVGEWASTGSELNHRTVGPTEVMQIETLHHADRQKTETYILDLLVWLSHLVSQSQASANGVSVLYRSFVVSPIANRTSGTPPTLLHDVNCKSQDQEFSNTRDSGAGEGNDEKLDKIELQPV